MHLIMLRMWCQISFCEETHIHMIAFSNKHHYVCSFITCPCTTAPVHTHTHSRTHTHSQCVLPQAPGWCCSCLPNLTLCCLFYVTDWVLPLRLLLLNEWNTSNRLYSHMNDRIPSTHCRWSYREVRRAAWSVSRSAPTEPRDAETEASGSLHRLRGTDPNLQNQAAGRTAPESPDTWHTINPSSPPKQSSHLWHIKNTPTFSPKSQGRWFACLSCDCECRSSHSSLAPPPHHRRPSRSNRSSHSQTTRYSCSPEWKRKSSALVRFSATVFQAQRWAAERRKCIIISAFFLIDMMCVCELCCTHLWGGTRLKSFKDDVHHPLWCQNVPAHHCSVQRWLKNGTGGNDDFHRGQTALK